MGRVGPRREVIVAAVAAGIALLACTGGSGSVSDETAPSVGRGTRAEPPSIPPPTSGSSSSGVGMVGPGPGCPSTRPTDAPTEELVEGEVRGRVLGIYRSCQTLEGLEIRVDGTSGELRWYLLDERFVRRAPPGFDGTLEIVSCADAECTVNWIEIDGTQPIATTYRLSLWEAPTALSFLQDQRPAQEWVRVAD